METITTPTTLPDIQRTVEFREVPIQRVGVTGIKLPIQVRRSPTYCLNNPMMEYMDTVGEFELAVAIPASVKATHMSRFTEVLNEHINVGGVFAIAELREVAWEIARKLEVNNAFVKLDVDYFMPQPAPVSTRPGMAPLRGTLQVECNLELNTVRTWTGVTIEGKTCCPCSKEISDYDANLDMGRGAHSQRGKITVLVEHKLNHVIWFEELVQAAWRSFSAPAYPVLKRPDERSVTMSAYDNPKFVEDVIRDMTLQLRQMPKVSSFTLRVQNSESIHYHDAFSELSEHKS